MSERTDFRILHTQEMIPLCYLVNFTMNKAVSAMLTKFEKITLIYELWCNNVVYIT